LTSFTSTAFLSFSLSLSLSGGEKSWQVVAKSFFLPPSAPVKREKKKKASKQQGGRTSMGV
jgi:hypothetical protein